MGYECAPCGRVGNVACDYLRSRFHVTYELARAFWGVIGHFADVLWRGREARMAYGVLLAVALETWPATTCGHVGNVTYELVRAFLGVTGHFADVSLRGREGAHGLCSVLLSVAFENVACDYLRSVGTCLANLPRHFGRDRAFADVLWRGRRRAMGL